LLENLKEGLGVEVRRVRVSGFEPCRISRKKYPTDIARKMEPEAKVL
jgi:hypothetical protein